MSGDDRPTKRYRILVVAPTSFFSDYGCSVRILEEIRALQKLGHEATICTYRNGQNVPGLTIRRTASIPRRSQYEVGSSLHKIAFDLLLFWTVLYAAVRHRPDVIHAHMHEGGLIALLVGRLLHVPMVFDFQGSLTGEMVDHRFLRRGSSFYRVLLWLEAVIDRRSSIILTSSENARQLLIAQFGCNPARVKAVPDCVNSEMFWPADAGEQASLAERRAGLGIPEGRKIVAYLGLLADYQGTDLLLQAAATVLQERSDVHFLIMGFPSVEQYQGMASQLGIADHTLFTGKIPYWQARDMLALGDVAVAPKLSATEGSGKILNYMAMGLPTVAFDTPVSREYLGDEGIYAQPGDPASLAQALLHSLAEPSTAGRGSALRRIAVQAYPWDHAAWTITSAYDAVCCMRRRMA